ncbi:ABC transporter substrate-binding protein [Marinobacter apostichopi]|uniref:ABC transporter substrate-binding protein n=1 Tax=Marinobacter apostichopi TaxID=3035454 RepID=UPI00257268E9|nr:ABC transporter substrate-binding protein [Marinobacter sp. LA51]
MASLPNRIAQILVIALLLPMPALSADSMIRLMDDRGHTLRLSEPATRPAAISTFGADVALALGRTPIAVTDYGVSGVPGYLASQLASASGLGPRHQPNLEVLSAVDPDLIIGIRRYTQKDSNQLAAIAPLLALDLITVDDSMRAVALAGQALGATDKASTLNRRFLAQVQSLAERNLADDKPTVALLTSGSETPFLYYDHFLPTALLEEMNFNHVGGAPPNPSSGIPLGYRINLEALLALNPDIILLLPTSRQRAFTMNPIWPYLSAVRNNNVHEVPHYWKEGAGPIARMLILEDIERLLLTGTVSGPDR